MTLFSVQDISQTRAVPILSMAASDDTWVAEYRVTDAVDGTELVTNGIFDSDATGWSAFGSTLGQGTYQGRVGALAVPDGGVWSAAYQTLTTEVGKYYLVWGDVYNGDSSLAENGILMVFLNGTFAQTWGDVTTVGKQTPGQWSRVALVFKATGTSTVLALHSDEGNVAYFDNISVREIVEPTVN